MQYDMAPYRLEGQPLHSRDTDGLARVDSSSIALCNDTDGHLRTYVRGCAWRKEESDRISHQ
jgi:hypothetical protein